MLFIQLPWCQWTDFEVPRTNKSVYIKPNVVTILFWSGPGRLRRSVFKCKNFYDGSDATEIKILFQNDTKWLDRFWKQNEIALINFPLSVWLISRLLIEFEAFDFIYCVCIVISMMCYLLLCSNVQIWMRECVTRKTCICLHHFAWLSNIHRKEHCVKVRHRTHKHTHIEILYADDSTMQ